MAGWAQGHNSEKYGHLLSLWLKSMFRVQSLHNRSRGFGLGKRNESVPCSQTAEACSWGLKGSGQIQRDKKHGCMYSGFATQLYPESKGLSKYNLWCTQQPGPYLPAGENSLLAVSAGERSPTQLQASQEKMLIREEGRGLQSTSSGTKMNLSL